VGNCMSRASSAAGVAIRARSTVLRHCAAALLLGATSLALGACGQAESSEPGGVQQALELDPDFAPDNPLAHALPASDYTLFEADPVRPVAVLADSGLVAVANTVDDYLELLAPTANGVKACGAVKVGMRPVAVAVVRQSRTDAELWVVNHLSDSLSIVHIDVAGCAGEVTDTLPTGDEPRDIVVTKNRAGKSRVFVTTAHRGQRHPLPSAKSGLDLTLPAQEKKNAGLADVFVFDPQRPSAAPSVVNLFSDTPRALAVGNGVVYAAGYRTGNRTSVVHAERAAQRGVDRLSELLAKDAQGQFLERDGELVLNVAARGRERMEGGMPAVVGSGRCVPDPRPDFADRFVQQVCVATDRKQRVEHVYVQEAGSVTPGCQCTSGSGALQATTSVIVKFFERRTDCGADYTTFPDGSRGCWLDAEPGGVRTPAAHASEQAPPMAWNDDVKLSLPDTDVFAIGVEDLRVSRAFSGVGTVLFGMAVQPDTGRLFVTNTEAQNLTHFEGEGQSSSSTVIGHLHESRITVIDPARNRVQPVHLNGHIDYGRCCKPAPRENENSLAFPTSLVFSPDGQKVYFSALGSDKVGIVRSDIVVPGFDNLGARRRKELKDITLGERIDAPSGPVGLELDAGRRRLYVKTHLSNELVVIDTRSERVTGRVRLHTPEPSSIRAGRDVFYNARLTSSHGDSACASCHTFGDFDGLSWDLGNPDGETVQNPGPFALPSELIALSGIARDPLGVSPLNRPEDPNFRSNKGPMNTQTLRGMANHGAQHWRGDRTRNFQDQTGHQPNFGSLDENNSFNEFDVAIPGLNGNDRALSPQLFQAFTDFALQLTLPPNPVRALDDSLTELQGEARVDYFGCASVSDEQLERRECVALDGALVSIDEETQRCACASNPLVIALHETPAVAGLGQLLQALLSVPELRAAFLAAAGDPTGLSPSDAAGLPALVERLSASIDALLTADLSPGDKGLFSAPASIALSGFSGSTLAIVQLPRSTAAATLTLDVLFGALPADAPFPSTAALASALESAFALSNLNLRTVQDEAARGGSGFHNLLLGCDPSQELPECRLRVTDGFHTCNGCHTLDAQGNAEFGVYRPGFFGTSGEYSFENESQVLKVPHLRNLYQKTGMFGTPAVQFFIDESVLGPRRGGFFAADSKFQGPQVRGFGFTHDGSGDTLERFHGTSLFAARPKGFLGAGDPGNVGGFDAVFPEAELRAACVGVFREGSPSVLGPLDPGLAGALALCSETSPVPDVCFLDPAAQSCQQALAALGAALGQPAFPQTFTAQILPACFQFGSMLEGGAPDGVCAPGALHHRAEMEAFMLAFDSNLKPMVGQQLTLHGTSGNDAFLRLLLAAAARGQCDLALRQSNRGLLVTGPDASRPERSVVSPARGRSTTLGQLRRDAAPITLTCYPPQDEQAEARRSAFDHR